MDQPTVAVVILTYNEEVHIARCIESVSDFANDILVIDSFSQDRTVEIAKSLGARVLQNPFVNQAVQFQWGLDHGELTSDWVFRIDADEYVETSAEEVGQTLRSLDEETTGGLVQRKYVFLGRWVKHGGMHPLYVLRLFRNGLGRCEARWMDEHIVLQRGTAKRLPITIVDDNHNPVDWWIAKHNSYASREMIEVLNREYRFLKLDDALSHSQGSQAKTKRLLKERVYSRLPIFVRQLFYFFYRYVVRWGFLDGTRGFAFHVMQGYWYRSLVDLKVLEARRWIGDEQNPDKIKAILAAKTGLKL